MPKLDFYFFSGSKFGQKMTSRHQNRCFRTPTGPQKRVFARPSPLKFSRQPFVGRRIALHPIIFLHFFSQRAVFALMLIEIATLKDMFLLF